MCGPIGLIHGDILQKNLMIARTLDGEWQLTSIIDWETARIGGDTLYDLLLGAWWLSSKMGSWHELRGTRDAFYSVVGGYTAIRGGGVWLGVNLPRLLELAELTFYLTTLPYLASARPLNMVSARKARVMEIVEGRWPGLGYF